MPPNYVSSSTRLMSAKMRFTDSVMQFLPGPVPAIGTFILFIHGDVDMNVPVGESIQMYTALKLLGKETAMVLVDGQEHHILEYGKRVQWQNTIWAWFAKWLKDDAAWWEAIYPKKNL